MRVNFAKIDELRDKIKTLEIDRRVEMENEIDRLLADPRNVWIQDNSNWKDADLYSKLCMMTSLEKDDSGKESFST